MTSNEDNLQRTSIEFEKPSLTHATVPVCSDVPTWRNSLRKSLLFFDGTRYRMGDFVVMPNHVHLLASFATEETMKTQCASWLHFTAVRINRTLGQQGKFWQQEPFDHLVRSQMQFDYLRKYIARNPVKAGLKPNEFYYRRYDG